ncbi:hypothetical protein [Arcanobacterium phocae]|uniref:hypothetical protein n=1 Tax=Arcanobacterium phocae TaxID=131112 RepID=UPI001C10DFA5|nr:hypothetical protein [Arcanobacterium phocae]
MTNTTNQPNAKQANGATTMRKEPHPRTFRIDYIDGYHVRIGKSPPMWDNTLRII